MEREIAKALLKIKAVGFVPENPITFKSGIISPVYVDNRKFPFHPPEWKVVIAGFKEVIEREKIKFDVVAGVEAAGIPHSAGLGFFMEKPSVFVRKQLKDHGTKSRIEGGNVEGKKVLLVEDLVTTGGSSLACVEALRSEGAEVSDCLVIVSYEFPESKKNFEEAKVRLHALASFTVLLEEAISNNIITEAESSVVKSWLRDPHAWTEKQKVRV